MVEEVPDEALDECKAFRGVLSRDGVQQFRTAIGLMQELNADVEHYIRGYRCSERESVCPSFHGLVYAERWQELDACVWRGSAGERKRSRQPKLHEVLARPMNKRGRGAAPAAPDEKDEPRVAVAEPGEVVEEDEMWNQQIFEDDGINEEVEEYIMPEDNQELVEVAEQVVSSTSSSSSSSSSTTSSSSSTSSSTPMRPTRWRRTPIQALKMFNSTLKIKIRQHDEVSWESCRSSR